MELRPISSARDSDDLCVWRRKEHDRWYVLDCATSVCLVFKWYRFFVVVGADGSFYKAVFDANGECQNTSYSKFIQSDEDE